MSLPNLFARTKIRPPRQRAGQVPRQALVSTLSEGIGQYRLALLTAPAGFGKTALLSQLLQQLPQATAWCWISADADDDLGRFITCLATALDPWDLPWRIAPEALAEQAQQGGSGLRQTALEVAATLGSSDLPQGLILVDDAHRIANPQVFEWLDALIEHLPPHWTLLLSSRVDPPLALPRWRARGEVLDLRQNHLQFTPDEIEAMLGALGHAPSPERLRSLAQRTQGWAAGLSLLLRTDQPGLGGLGEATSRPVQDRHMFDFLASEVLDGLPAELRQFLLRCAVLPELTATRCAQVSGLEHAWRLLDDIERMGLFVTVLDEAELTLQLHDLFRDFLQDRLRKEAPQDWPALLQLAAQTEPDPLRQMGFLLQAKAWADAEATLFEQAPRMIASGQAPQVLRLVEQFPPHWRDDSARLTHLHGQCAWAQWDLVSMVQALARAADLYDAQGESACAQEARMLQVLGLAAGGQVLPSYALLAQLRTQPLSRQAEVIAWQASSWHAVAGGLYDQVAAPFDKMVTLLLEDKASPMLWLQSVPLTSFLGLPGTRAPLQRYVHGALALSQDAQGDPTPLSVMAHILQAALDLWAGEVEQAARRLQTARDDCRWLNQPPNLMGYWSLFDGLTQAVRGQRAAALASVQIRLASLDDERTSGRKATWLNHFYFFQVRVACILEDHEALDQACALLQANPKPDEHRLFVRERTTLPARLAARHGRWDEAAALYQQALSQDEQGIDLYGQALETRLRLAHAQLRSGQLDAAAQSVALALVRAHDRGDIGPALFAGPQVLNTLAAHDWQDALAPEQRQTLRARAARLPALAVAAQPAAAPVGITPPGTTVVTCAEAAPAIVYGPAPTELTMAHLLSSRERDVLRFMSVGHSNKLIARELDLSPHTVKRHVANILDKLGVSSRGQAVARHTLAS